MTETASRTDMGLGLGLMFAAVAILGAAGMYLGAANHVVAGLSFGLAVAAGCLSVLGIHVYE